ncbi:MAG: YdcF family protein [Nitrospiraceae bacterium]|nr:YdcF family protein [Nitrospiraceae bacterium]
MWTRRKLTLLASLICLAGLVLAMFCFVYAASLLVVETPPRQADVGIVLAGDFSRALYAADLYHHGFVPRVWLSRPERERILRQLDALGVPYPRQEEVSRAVLLQKKVPSDHIELFGNGVVSTIEEARAVAELLGQRPDIHSLLLVTSRFHVRRSEAIFRRILKDHSQLEIHAVGSPYDGLVVDHWWKDRDSARQVVLETAKWLLFWVYTEF